MGVGSLEVAAAVLVIFLLAVFTELLSVCCRCAKRFGRKVSSLSLSIKHIVLQPGPKPPPPPTPNL